MDVRHIDRQPHSGEQLQEKTMEAQKVNESTFRDEIEERKETGFSE